MLNEMSIIIIKTQPQDLKHCRMINWNNPIQTGQLRSAAVFESKADENFPKHCELPSWLYHIG